MIELPKSTKVVVIGGGVAGCSVAYHLAKFGWKDTILLERDQLTSGTTWHAAGLVSQLGPSAAITKIRKYTTDLYKELEKKIDFSAGLKLNGALSIATTKGRWQELQRQATTAQLFDVHVEVLNTDQIKKIYPIINEKDILGGIFMPGDGQADPIGVTNLLAKAAKREGAKLGDIMGGAEREGMAMGGMETGMNLGDVSAAMGTGVSADAAMSSVADAKMASDEGGGGLAGAAMGSAMSSQGAAASAMGSSAMGAAMGVGGMGEGGMGQAMDGAMGEAMGGAMGGAMAGAMAGGAGGMEGGMMGGGMEGGMGDAMGGGMEGGGMMGGMEGGGMMGGMGEALGGALGGEGGQGGALGGAMGGEGGMGQGGMEGGGERKGDPAPP